MPQAQALFSVALTLLSPRPKQICYPPIRVKISRFTRWSPELTRATGEEGVRADTCDEPVRHELIAMLPRLKRFADVLAGEKKEGRTLLRRSLLRMLKDQSSYQDDAPFDRWAFAEIYRLWEYELCRYVDPLRQAKASENDFQQLMAPEQGANFDALTANFLGQLSPRQRGTLLLVYGEGFSHDDAGRVLDSNSDAVRSRLVRASAGLADRLSGKRTGEGDRRRRGALLQKTADKNHD